MMQHLFGKPHMIRRCIVLVLSTCLMGVGVAIFDQIGFGTDPCSVLNLAVSRKIGWSYGDWLLTINAVIFVLLLLLGEAKRFGLGSHIEIGASADLTVFNFDDEYEINPDDFLSKGRSTPFKGMKVYGKCLMTMCGGNIVWQEEEND